MFNLDFLVDESSFGMSQAIQKCVKLTKHPNFRKKIREPGVFQQKFSNIFHEKAISFLKLLINFEKMDSCDQNFLVIK